MGKLFESLSFNEFLENMFLNRLGLVLCSKDHYFKGQLPKVNHHIINNLMV